MIFLFAVPHVADITGGATDATESKSDYGQDAQSSAFGKAMGDPFPLGHGHARSPARGTTA
jgi:hypothetical protein